MHGVQAFHVGFHNAPGGFHEHWCFSIETALLPDLLYGIDDVGKLRIRHAVVGGIHLITRRGSAILFLLADLLCLAAVDCFPPSLPVLSRFAVLPLRLGLIDGKFKFTDESAACRESGDVRRDALGCGFIDPAIAVLRFPGGAGANALTHLISTTE